MESKKQLLALKDINFSYNKKNRILNGLNLKVFENEIIGISGENGSGKSTLLKLLVGMLKPSSGEIMVNGEVGYSPQNLLLFENLTIAEN